MKKFLVLLLVFIIPLTISWIAMELLLRNIPNEYSIKKDYLDKNSNEIEILILGSSHTFGGVNPVFISGNSYNSAIFAQSLDYDYKILKKYEGKWDKLHTIVIPISYFSLYFNSEITSKAWRVKNYNIYFDLYEEGEWKYLTETFSTPFRINISRIINYYILNLENIRITRLGWDSKFTKQKPHKLMENGREAAERHSKESGDLMTPNLDEIKKILSLAEQNNWNILFVTPPAFHTYRNHLNQDQLNNTIDTISNLSLLYENVKYYNLIDSPKFIKEDFYNADHLNGKGASKFSKLLNNLIEKDFN